MDWNSVPLSWRDPSGWRPTALQRSVPPETAGIPIEEWERKQPLWTPEQRLIWISMHGPDAVVQKSVAARVAKGR